LQRDKKIKEDESGKFMEWANTKLHGIR